MKKITSLFKDDAEIREILLNGPRHLVVIRKNQQRETLHSWFSDQKTMSYWLQEFAFAQGIRLDPNYPAAGGFFFDEAHYRWYATLPTISPSGPIVSIRRQHFHEIPTATLFPELSKLLMSDALQEHPTIIYGATGSGKTTCLLHLLSHLPEERIMIIDSQLEFNLNNSNHICFTARPADSEGRGEYPILRLMRDILRLSPDRMVCAEIRSDEAAVFFQSLTSGHKPPLCTLHAGRLGELRDRLTMLALTSGIPSEILNESFKRTYNLIEMRARPQPHVHSLQQEVLL